MPLYYVRTLADSLALRAALAPAKKVAILGGGFIGLEVAAAVTQAGCEATVIRRAARSRKSASRKWRPTPRSSASKTTTQPSPHSSR
ncbi:FAD-dependent oxidoreductase, partial [Mesorhizobium sp. M3A.F.Ca.ET.174.01.1.1]|uniref:FAD-dependent oxidoreductase n=1 Tax=Mesorhizobium sp. M3A.F.Ca.ET.174.01.1.1 TaxID=2563944 RepID=UPI0032AF7F6F